MKTAELINRKMKRADIAKIERLAGSLEILQRKVCHERAGELLEKAKIAIMDAVSALKSTAP